MCIGLIIVVIAMAIMCVRAADRGELHYGVAATIDVAGEQSPFVGLAVGNDGRLLADSEPRVYTGEYDGPLTDDQQRSLDTAWGAACVALGQADILGPDQTLACATTTQRPAVTPSAATRGSSAGLRDTLMYIDWHFDIAGDLRVAATGTIDVTGQPNPDGSTDTVVDVAAIAGVEQKAQAAAAADVDLLVVPDDNLAEFARQQVLTDAGVELAGASTIIDAVHAVCSRSRTEVCEQRFLDE
jgi:hypothetical protein